MQLPEQPRIAVIGLGYVGLPLAAEFGRFYDTVGFDIKTARVEELRSGQDSTREVSAEELAQADRLQFSSDEADLKSCNVYIVTVPTPIDDANSPDLQPLIGASQVLGRAIGAGDVVIYESTVYPGCTEEVCVPVIEELSGLKLNQDFFAGYSPERINPGDKARRLKDIVKVTAGSTPEAGEFVDSLYKRIIVAGTHPVSSIRAAEASKIIENTQRDLNIALINEVALIMNRLGIDTQEVLEAAGTKWNFLPFRPGLVGGHCIGIDPYYLTHKAQQIGYHPDVILAGRRINDGMGAYVGRQVIDMMTRKKIPVVDARVLIMGLTFKEDCPDIRNSRVPDVMGVFSSYGAQVDVYDPWASPKEAEHYYGIKPIAEPQAGQYDAIILCVAHEAFRDMGANAIRGYGKANHVLYDVKYLLSADEVDGRL